MTDQEIHEAIDTMTLAPVLSPQARTIVDAIKLVHADCEDRPRSLWPGQLSENYKTIRSLWALLGRCGAANDTVLAHSEIADIIVEAVMS